MNRQLTIQDFFRLGMKRDIPDLLPITAPLIELGGNDPFLRLPKWDAEAEPIPYSDATVRTIFAFHFFEHLTARSVRRVLLECQRVLKIGGTLNVCVPYYSSQIAFEDQDHKTFWSEESWKRLLLKHYGQRDLPEYEPFKFHVHANFIMGIVERNMALFTQLVRIE